MYVMRSLHIAQNRNVLIPQSRNVALLVDERGRLRIGTDFDERARAATYRGSVEGFGTAHDGGVGGARSGLTTRQVHRLLQAYDRDGADGLASKKRGRPSNRRHTDDFRGLVLDLVRESYADFGPTLACEKLIERHHIAVSKETLRKWMTEAGLWKSRQERKRQPHQPRGRRDCLGELVQIDGSHHWWFEGRGPKCALLVYIDDATGKLLHLRFAGSENTFDYFHATKAYLQEWGKASDHAPVWIELADPEPPASTDGE